MEHDMLQNKSTLSALQQSLQEVTNSNVVAKYEAKKLARQNQPSPYLLALCICVRVWNLFFIRCIWLSSVRFLLLLDGVRSVECSERQLPVIDAHYIQRFILPSS